MKKLLILILSFSLLTACSSSAGSDSQSESSAVEESSAAYEDVKVKDIIFPASCKLEIDTWSGQSYHLIYNQELEITVHMSDISESISKYEYIGDDENFVKLMFASLELLDVSENAADGVTSEKTYSDSGFRIYSLSKDDVYAYYATQVINDTYYEITVSSKYYKPIKSDSTKELKEYYDEFCDIINSIKPA